MDEALHVNITFPGHSALVPVLGKEHAELSGCAVTVASSAAVHSLSV